MLYSLFHKTFAKYFRSSLTTSEVRPSTSEYRGEVSCEFLKLNFPSPNFINSELRVGQLERFWRVIFAVFYCILGIMSEPEDLKKWMSEFKNELDDLSSELIFERLNCESFQNEDPN